jgi:hypothetical protein
MQPQQQNVVLDDSEIPLAVAKVADAPLLRRRSISDNSEIIEKPLSGNTVNRQDAMPTAKAELPAVLSPQVQVVLPDDPEIQKSALPAAKPIPDISIYMERPVGIRSGAANYIHDDSHLRKKARSITP